jgi:hypothetical protein
MKIKLNYFFATLSVFALVACGAVKDKVTEVKNDFEIQGSWLMTQSEHSSKIEKFLENESMVLTFKDSKAAFSPTDSVKGRAVHALLSKCLVDPRRYRMEKNQIVFEAVVGCEERRVTIEALDQSNFKAIDPEDGETIRTFRRISEEVYHKLVKPSERKL